jgi:hypothetical protein
MGPLATALINWHELWEIIVAALVGGAGVVIAFGLLLLSVSRGKTATNAPARLGLYTLSGLCGVLVVVIAALGVYAMTQKPSSAKPKPKTAVAMLAPASITQQQAAGSSLTVAAMCEGRARGDGLAQRERRSATGRAQTLA